MQRSFKAWQVGLLLFATALALLVYWYFDPSRWAFFPRCPTKLLFGLECPGCGAQRMLHALLQGDFKAAWQYNAFLLCLSPLLLALAYIEWRSDRYPKLYSWLARPMTLVVLGLAALAWTIYRNSL